MAAMNEQRTADRAPAERSDEGVAIVVLTHSTAHLLRQCVETCCTERPRRPERS